MNLSNIEVSNNDDGITNLIIKSKNILINDEFINDFIESIDFISNYKNLKGVIISTDHNNYCLLYTSPSPRDS